MTEPQDAQFPPTSEHVFYLASDVKSAIKQLWFECPGCKNPHAYTIGGGRGWTWNGSMDKPVFSPSLLCNPDHLESRCHSFVGGQRGHCPGQIEFLNDCWHELKGQTVPLPVWNHNW